MVKRKNTPPEYIEYVVLESRSEKINALPAEVRTIYDQLEPLFERTRQGKLLLRYRIGEILKAAVPDLQKRANKKPALMKISDNLVEYLAEALDVPHRTLYRCLQLAREYKPERFQQLVACSWVTWQHVVNLLDVKNPKLQREMESTLVAEKLSAGELKSEIRTRKDNDRPGSGRPLKVPVTLNRAIDQLTTTALKFVRCTNEVWFGGGYNIAGVIADRPPDEIDENTLQQINKGIDVLEAVKEAANKGINEFRLAKQRVEEPLNDRVNEAKTRQRTAKRDAKTQTSV